MLQFQSVFTLYTSELAQATRTLIAEEQIKMAAYDASFTFSRLLFDLEKPQNPQVLTVLVDVDECLCTNQDKWRLNYPQLTKTLMKEEKDLEGKKQIFIFIQLSLFRAAL